MFKAGMKVRVVRIVGVDPDDAHEIFQYLPYSTVVLRRNDYIDSGYGASWLVLLERDSILGRRYGCPYLHEGEDIFGCYFYEQELEPEGPPETVRDMSARILAQLR